MYLFTLCMYLFYVFILHSEMYVDEFMEFIMLIIVVLLLYVLLCFCFTKNKTLLKKTKYKYNVKYIKLHC